jgi:hypothetical protein
VPRVDAYEGARERPIEVTAHREIDPIDLPHRGGGDGPMECACDDPGESRDSCLQTCRQREIVAVSHRARTFTKSETHVVNS